MQRGLQLPSWYKRSVLSESYKYPDAAARARLLSQAGKLDCSQRQACTAAELDSAIWASDDSLDLFSDMDTSTTNGNAAAAKSISSERMHNTTHSSSTSSTSSTLLSHPLQHQHLHFKFNHTISTSAPKYFVNESTTLSWRKRLLKDVQPMSFDPTSYLPRHEL